MPASKPPRRKRRSPKPVVRLSKVVIQPHFIIQDARGEVVSEVVGDPMKIPAAQWKQPDFMAQFRRACTAFAKRILEGREHDQRPG